MAKQNLYKTAKYRGQYVSIIDSLENSDSTWRYSIKLQDGSILVGIEERFLSEFCL